MELYHVLNRGVDRRRIFMGPSDYVRFVHNLWEFNDASPAVNTRRFIRRERLLSPQNAADKPIVELHGWCLMPNHYHLLLSEIVEGGLTLFIRKLNVGYANFFNEKYERQGTLFQGRTKRVFIQREAHFLHILHYLHLNPLDMVRGEQNWREGIITNTTRALDHLSKYRWSSYLDYAGTRNFPSVLSTTLFRGVFDDYKSALTIYMKNLEFANGKPLTLE